MSVGAWMRLRPRVAVALVWSSLLALSACTTEPPELGIPPRDAYPVRLSQWGLLERHGNALVLHPDALPYDLATPLFTDYALKLRTVWMPEGTAALFADDAVFEFPVGTILSKTFYYPRAGDGGRADTVLGIETDSHGFDDPKLSLAAVRVIETRLLVRQADGWDALVYVWDSMQRDAILQPTGDIQPLNIRLADGERTFHYVVPNHNECASCHAVDQNARRMQPIGPAARNLAKTYAHYADGAAPQLERWRERGFLRGGVDADARSVPVWNPETDDRIEARARAYLDINCGHCHQPGGAADTSGLYLHQAERSLRRLGVCKPPIAAGTGTGGHRFSIVPGQPEASILIFRTASEHPAVRMPEVGRSLAHGAGVALLSRWIADMPGEC